MDEYDLRRLWSFKNKTLRLSQDELVALNAVDPHISAEDLARFAGQSDMRDQTTDHAPREGGS